jgi:hypothetical protein
MQNQMLGFFIVTCVSLGVLCGVQWKQLRDKKLEAGQLRQQLADQTTVLGGQASAIQTLQREQNRLSLTMSNLNTQIRTLQDTTNQLRQQLSALTLDSFTNSQAAGPLTGLFGALLQEPSAQAWFLSREKRSLAMLFGPDAEEHIKTLLGDERYANYQNYTHTIGDRSFLEPYCRQLETERHPLRDEQFSRLLTLLAEERKQLAPRPQLLDSTPATNKLSSEDIWQASLQWQEELNGRVLEQSRDFLLPDQVQALARFQTNQIQIQKIGWETIRRLHELNSPRSPPSGPPLLK